VTGTTHSLFDGVRRVLFLHAHPDDETLSTGGTIAMLVGRGVEVTVLTGTRGERGEVVPGPLAELEGTPALAPHRVQELAGAMRALGVLDQRFLGSRSARAAGMGEREYVDSGMVWATPTIAAAAPDAPPDALSRADLHEVAADITAVIRETQPDLIVTYNARGGYGHPDHVRMHDAGVVAAVRTGTPLALVEEGEDPDDSAGVEPGAERDRGERAPEWEHRERARPECFDVRPWLPKKVAALAEHRSQLSLLSGGQRRDRGGEPAASYQLSGGQIHQISAVECFRPYFPAIDAATGSTPRAS
jgi:N-acetyl-1-D-myo-inositol-2-amino-2-deoxy-alpha-D-glucopyranoside deacetylase